jgi:hypothetical protein
LTETADAAPQAFAAPMPATQEDLEVLRGQLGRIPRGVVGIGARCVCGRPTVVATAPRLEDGTPFPTTFYLTCPPAVRGCSTLEAEHVMEGLTRWVSEDPDARSAYLGAHRDYLARREAIARAAGIGEVAEISGVSAGGMPARVKCLHALVGHALVAGRGVNPVGDRALEMLAERGLWRRDRCTC